MSAPAILDVAILRKRLRPIHKEVNYLYARFNALSERVEELEAERARRWLSLHHTPDRSDAPRAAAE